jgi:hypothetical protein
VVAARKRAANKRGTSLGGGGGMKAVVNADEGFEDIDLQGMDRASKSHRMSMSRSRAALEADANDDDDSADESESLGTLSTNVESDSIESDVSSDDAVSDDVSSSDGDLSV